MRPLAIFKLGSTYAELAHRKGDFTDWVARSCRLDAGGLVVIEARHSAPLPAPDSLGGAVLTGSHRFVTDREPWSEAVAAWIRSAVSADLPLLGICYGHQLIAQALGGQVAPNPAGLEFGTIEVTTAAGAARDPLFHTLPPRFSAHACHAQTVTRLPAGATLLAFSDGDAHQAFRVGNRCWGVQFHPEFDEEATGFYIERYAPDLAEQGCDPGQLKANLKPTPQSRAILAAFTAIHGPLATET